MASGEEQEEEEINRSFRNLGLEEDIDLDESFCLLELDDDEDLGCESLFSPELNREVNKSDHHSVLHVEQPKKLLSGQKKRKSDKSAEKTEPPDKKTDQKETPKKHQEVTKKKLQTVTGPKPSSSFYKRRRGSFKDILHDHLIVSPGKEVEQEYVLKVLCLDEKSSSKVQATNAMKEAFPNSVIKRRASTGKIRKVYIDVDKKLFSSPISQTDDRTSQSSKDTSAISKLKNAVATKEAELGDLQSLIQSELNKETPDKDTLTILFQKTRLTDDYIRQYRDAIDHIYVKELEKLTKTDLDRISGKEKNQLLEEIVKLDKVLETGVFCTDITSNKVSEVISGLPANIKSNCPLIFHIIETLFLTKSDNTTHEGRRELDALHAIGLLSSLRNLNLTNDIKRMFTLLCISYGAGNQFINMLQHIGVTFSWSTMMNFLDKRIKEMRKMREVKMKEASSIMLLMDNINMYRGKRKHIRLFKYIGPKMWNFTGRAMLIPSITKEVTELMIDSSNCTKPQKDPLSVTLEDLLYESDTEKVKMWDSATDQYMLQLLHDGLNKVCPQLTKTSKKLKNMNEKECTEWLSNMKNFDVDPKEAKYKIKFQPIVVNDKKEARCSDINILELSLEDNSTITGTCNILHQFAVECQLLLPKDKPEQIVYDRLQNTFNFKKAREHFELLIMQHHHQDYMASLETRLRSVEKELEEIAEQLEEDDTVQIEGVTSVNRDESTTLENEQRVFQEFDKPFWKVFNGLYGELCRVMQTQNQEMYLKFVVDTKAQESFKASDHFQRSLLHVAVEQSNLGYVKFLIDIGCDVNSKEGCGLTPLSLAVLLKKVDMCKALVDSGANYDGPLFTSIPSPLKMAHQLNLPEIVSIFDSDIAAREEENNLICLIDERYSVDNPLPEVKKKDPASKDKHCFESIRKTQGFITHIVGDVGTCKTNQAVISRSSEFSWVGITPGDLHNKGYFCQAIYRIHGSSGMHYILNKVMKRSKLTNEVFKDKLFNDYNLEMVREGMRDGCRSYGLAAVLEFQQSSFFPSPEELKAQFQVEHNHGRLLLKQFKKWILSNSADDIAFSHRVTAFTFYGPLLNFYNQATSYSDGKARELVYQLQFPIYCQLGYRNYFTETFRHVFNMLAKWPKVARCILWDNCSINLSGNKGHAMELDAFVETEVVKPIKMYSSTHSTVAVCERIMGNLDLFKAVRRGYGDHSCFDIHHTTRHSVPDPIVDQVKGAWFALRKGFFKASGKRQVDCYPLSNEGVPSGKLTSMYLDVYSSGKKKVEDKFEQKVYETFPDLRYSILTSDNQVI